ncbi:MAG: hypothetical protein ACR2IM_04125 [Sediminibacterium sp.]
MKTIINWLSFIGVVTVNALANIIPINGYNTGQISAFYPNYFVPAGFTFSIWGLIYLFFLNYSIAHTYFTFKQKQFPQIIKYLDQITPWYWATCILNIFWILAWHYLQILTSVVIMITFLLVLIQIFIYTRTLTKDIKLLHRFLIIAPFTVYIGWISVALIANISALLVYLQWNGWGLAPENWAVIMIAIAIVLAFCFSYFYDTIAAPLVITWALWGIMHGQGGQIPLLHTLSLIGICAIFVLSIRLIVVKFVLMR